MTDATCQHNPVNKNALGFCIDCQNNRAIKAMFKDRPMKTMTLNLPEKEMDILEEMATRKDVSKTALMRQALRLYQLIDVRLTAGERMYFSGDKEREVLFVGLYNSGCMGDD